MNQGFSATSGTHAPGASEDRFLGVTFSCWHPLCLCKTTPRGEFVKVLTGRNKERQGDDRLLVEAAQRDPARFAELYENHFERV